MNIIEIIIIIVAAYITIVILFENTFNESFTNTDDETPPDSFIKSIEKDFADRVSNCNENDNLLCESKIFTRDLGPSTNAIMNTNKAKEVDGLKYNWEIATYYNEKVYDVIRPFTDLTGNWSYSGPRNTVKLDDNVDEEDIENARKYAFVKLCMFKGYDIFIDKDSGEYSCEFNKNKCLEASNKIADMNVVKYGSENSPVKSDKCMKPIDKYPYMEWRNRAGCIRGNETFKKFCEEDTMCTHGKNNWHYNRDNGYCYITNKYCNPFGLKEKNGECKPRDGQAFAEALLGKTMYRKCLPEGLPLISSAFTAMVAAATNPEPLSKKVMLVIALVAMGVMVGGCTAITAIKGCPKYTKEWRENSDPEKLSDIISQKCMPSPDPVVKEIEENPEKYNDGGQKANEEIKQQYSADDMNIVGGPDADATPEQEKITQASKEQEPDEELDCE